MVAFQGGHPPFKGNSPHLRPQPSRAESSPTRSKVLPLRRRGWVPRVMQAGPGQKKPNRCARLKGKCALGPFLSILVIECQHKCLYVIQCLWMNKVQI
jgi:hypothetical protein